MANTVSSPIALGWPAPQFDLPGIDGRRHTPSSARGPNGLLVMFICNHCPYVKAVVGKIVRDTAELASARHRQHRDHEQRCSERTRRIRSTT